MLSDDDTLTDLTPLRYVRSITAPLSPLQARRFTDRFGAFVLNSYGQAEIGEVIGWTAADAKEHPEKVGAIGRPHGGVDLKVVDDAGRELGTDEIGGLFVRPPNMAAGYATGEELSDRVDADGYVNTGDLARVDGDGFVWIEGRAGDLDQPRRQQGVPRAGRGSALPRARDLARRPWSACPTTGSARCRWHSSSATPATRSYVALCREHLVPYKVPVAFEHIDALPRTEVGKVMRRELVSEYQARAT